MSFFARFSKIFAVSLALAFNVTHGAEGSVVHEEKETKVVSPAPSSTPVAVIVPSNTPSKKEDSNLSVGVSYIFPMFHFQHRLSDTFSLGIQSVLVDYLTPVGNKLRGYDGRLTVNYYQQSLYEGLWIQGAFGIALLSATNNVDTESLTLPTSSVLLGWRWKWESGLNFGFGAGAQYIFNAKTQNFNLDFSGVWPALTLDLGFCL